MREYDYGRRRCRFSKTLIFSFLFLFSPVSMILCIFIGMILFRSGEYGPYIAPFVIVACAPVLIFNLLVGLKLLFPGIASQCSICSECGECAARRREKQKSDLCKNDKNAADLCKNNENKPDL